MKYPSSRSASTALCRLTGSSHALLTGRGAAGITAALRVAGFQNRPVLLPANTCYIVLWAVLESGNQPVLVDVDAQTGNLTAATLEACPIANPAAVIPCHMYGLSASMSDIMAWARRKNVFVIEDAALAVGAQVEGRPAGTWGDTAIFSFGQGKIVDMQAGGAVLTNDSALSRDIQRLLDAAPLWTNQQIDWANQWHSLYWALHQYEAANPRLADLYPPLFEMYRSLITCRLAPDDWNDLPAGLKILPENLAHRAAIADIYDRLIEATPARTLPRPTGSVIWRYPLLIDPEHRRDLLEYLWSQGIHDATRWYPSLRYMFAALAPHLPTPITPRADGLGASIINLPVDASIDTTAALKIVGLIQDYFAEIEDE